MPSVCLVAAFIGSLFTAGDGKIVLVGEGLKGWRPPTGEWVSVGSIGQDPDNPKLLVGKPGAGVLLNGPTGRTVNLVSEAVHGDARVHVEFMVPLGSNSGVYLQGRYEVQVYDSWGVKEPKHSDCGGIYQRYVELEQRGFEGHAPRVNASKKPGEWQSFDILFRAPRFDAAGKKTADAQFVRVIHNGTVVHEHVHVTGPTRAAAFRDEKPTGPLMFQGDHGPVAYRNLTLEALEEGQ